MLASHPEEVRSFFEDTVAPIVRYAQCSTELVGTLSSYPSSNCNMNDGPGHLRPPPHGELPAHRIRELTGLDPLASEDRERLGLGLGLGAYRIIAPTLPR